MPEVAISQITFERLQRHAMPLVDTLDTVIARALEALEQLSTDHALQSGPLPDEERRIDHRALPDLTHAKILEASIDGRPMAKANWKLLVETMLRRTKKQMGDFEKVRRFCPVNIVKGRKEDEGFTYLPDIDVSFQGQDANSACRAAITAAQGLGLSLDIVFMWRPKEGAAHPGERARLVVARRSA